MWPTAPLLRTRFMARFMLRNLCMLVRILVPLPIYLSLSSRDRNFTLPITVCHCRCSRRQWGRILAYHARRWLRPHRRMLSTRRCRCEPLVHFNTPPHPRSPSTRTQPISLPAHRLHRCSSHTLLIPTPFQCFRRTLCSRRRLRRQLPPRMLPRFLVTEPATSGISSQLGMPAQ